MTGLSVGGRYLTSWAAHRCADRNHEVAYRRVEPTRQPPNTEVRTLILRERCGQVLVVPQRALGAGIDLGLAILDDARLPEDVHAAQVVWGLTAIPRHIRWAIVPLFIRPQRLQPLQT